MKERVEVTHISSTLRGEYSARTMAPQLVNQTFNLPLFSVPSQSLLGVVAANCYNRLQATTVCKATLIRRLAQFFIPKQQDHKVINTFMASISSIARELASRDTNVTDREGKLQVQNWAWAAASSCTYQLCPILALDNQLRWTTTYMQKQALRLFSVASLSLSKRI